MVIMFEKIWVVGLYCYIGFIIRELEKFKLVYFFYISVVLNLFNLVFCVIILNFR